MNCVTKFIQISTVGNVNKLSETKKKQLKTLKKVWLTQQILKKGTDGQTWRRLKRIKIVVLENLLALELSKFIFVVWNVWYDWETYLFDTKLWFASVNFL